MPKPGKFKNSWKNYYNDDYAGNDNIRRVTFKANKHGNKNERKDWGESIRAHLIDEDIDMGASSNNAKIIPSKKFFKKKGGRAGSPMPMKNFKRKLLDGPLGWFKVTLPYGNKYDKQYILKTLLDKINPMPFIPIMWTTHGTAVVFYVDDFKLAEKLCNIDREIQLPDGFKLLIRVNTGCPNVDVNVELKERMKLAMAKRYNAATKALDLTRFHVDPSLQDLFCALFKPIIFLAVIEIIAENIPEIEAINLHDNKLQLLGHFKKLNVKLPNLKILHMSNNKIKDIAQLDSLLGLPIVDLVLDGNPLCDKFKDQATYISEVRKRFPKVTKLDGIELPPPISFDIPNDINLPPTQNVYLCNIEGQGIMRQFLEQYFLIMDSENRRPLLEAYHEEAMFSMTMCYPYGQHQKNSSWLNWYSTDNRNLMRIVDNERRHKLLKQGPLAIVSFLQEMPGTKHDKHGFTVDLNLFTPSMILLTVTGVFREVRSGHKVPPFRSFFRTLVIVPAGSGFCIANEELHITNATEEQVKESFKTPTPAPVDVPDAGPSVVLNDQTKQQMIQAMSQQSGMNLAWSEKCLRETNWNFQQAGIVFTELNNLGKVPADAFVK